MTLVATLRKSSDNKNALDTCTRLPTSHWTKVSTPESTMAAQIAEVLTATLNPEPNTRITAELRLAESFASPGTLILPKSTLPSDLIHLVHQTRA